MGDVSGLSPSGSNPGVGLDHTANSHLGNCSYGAFVGEKFYAYVAVIEMLHVLATDENARKQLFESIEGSDFWQWQKKRSETLGWTYEFLKERWFGDPAKSEEAREKAKGTLEEWTSHRDGFLESLKDSLLGYYNEIVKRYRECGVAYAFSTVAIDGAFTLGELAIGAGIAGAASKVIKSLRFFFRKTLEGHIRIRVENPNGGHFEKAFTKHELEAKYGAPEDNHTGILSPDENKAVAAGSAANGKHKMTRSKGLKTNENEITYDPKTGRPINAKGTLRTDFGSSPRGDNATAVGKLGQSGDQGGHLVGHRFMGDTPDYGIAPQAGNLNQGAWKTMENEWADWVNKGYEVDYNIDVYPPGSVRPDSFDVSYAVKDPKTGQIKYQKSKEFENKAGETFDRIRFRDME
ncbi:hypothetical protein HB779_08210 [Phyllobacterium sp. 628]|uniref:DNA/RNA non-specific endonuclease n=1 Tax=Phyllobacterium sp. 628 TaxID=2718938 RepID=UPI00166239EA|nr:DNA/RNA non-specific endonuclease [Phyllobacterium sp. 628]QND51888.1 hypothetical protein HB779_08210 [Phyllobacterium sp. 628]